jgi:hypothetical protein
MVLEYADVYALWKVSPCLLQHPSVDGPHQATPPQHHTPQRYHHFAAASCSSNMPRKQLAALVAASLAAGASAGGKPVFTLKTDDATALPNGHAYGCLPGNVSADLPFCNASLTIDERLVSPSVVCPLGLRVSPHKAWHRPPFSRCRGVSRIARLASLPPPPSSERPHRSADPRREGGPDGR